MIDDQSPCADADTPDAPPDLADVPISVLLRSDALANAVRRVVDDLSTESYAAFGNAPAEPGRPGDGSGGRRLDVALGPLAPPGVQRLGVLGAEQPGELLDG
jgi:hypothetical protein